MCFQLLIYYSLSLIQAISSEEIDNHVNWLNVLNVSIFYVIYDGFEIKKKYK